MRSFEDSVVPVNERRVGFVFAPKWPLFMAFLTRSANDGNDWAEWVNSRCALLLLLEDTLESNVSDLAVVIEFEDCEVVIIEGFDTSDDPKLANDIHRFFSVDDDDDVDAWSVGASESSDDIESTKDAWLARYTLKKKKRN